MRRMTPRLRKSGREFALLVTHHGFAGGFPSRTRDHNRQLGQSLMAFRMTQAKTWLVAEKKNTAEFAEFEVVPQPGKETSRYMPTVRQVYRLSKEKGEWRITAFSSLFHAQ